MIQVDESSTQGQAKELYQKGLLRNTKGESMWKKSRISPIRDDGDNDRQQISPVKVDSGIRPQIKLSMNCSRKTNTFLAS